MESIPIIFTPEFVGALRAEPPTVAPIAEHFAIRPTLAGYRGLLEAAIAEVAEPQRTDLVERVRDRDNRNHSAATWELLIHAWGRQLGYTVTPADKAGNRYPDWLFARAEPTCIVEVATVSRSTSEEGRRQKLTEQLERLARLAGPGLRVAVDTYTGKPPEGLPPRAFETRARKHLDAIHAGTLPWTAPLVIGDMRVTFEPGKGTHGVVTTHWAELETTTADAIRRVLRYKSGQYREAADSAIPRVVALCNGPLFADFFGTIRAAVLGPTYYRGRDDGTGSVTWETVLEARDAFFSWSPDRNRRISAVLGCEKYLLDDGVELGLQLWHNPNASAPLAPGTFGALPEIFRASRDGNQEVYGVRGPLEAQVRLTLPISTRE
jgi:hypothetical protein